MDNLNVNYDMHNLNVNSEELLYTANNYKQIASEVRDKYTKILNIIEQVTANDSWKGDARNHFLEKFDGIRHTLESHLQELESLGPALQVASNNYSNAESENIGMM